jgi:hypothetical protein
VLNLELKPASSVKLEVAQKRGLSLELKPESASSVDLNIGCKLEKNLVLRLAPFYRGPTGEAASISADEGNLIREGLDGKMFAQMEWTGTPNW